VLSWSYHDFIEGPRAMPTTIASETPWEVAILARMLGGGDDKLPTPIARYVLSLSPSTRDTTRMRDLAARNRDGALTPAEKDELLAYAKAGTLMSILKSKARRTLGVKPVRRSAP
jgi:hypothetical protein